MPITPESHGLQHHHHTRCGHMDSTVLESAVRNNAAWCQEMACARGLPGQFETGLWVHPEPMPPFYPNAITLAGSSALHQHARIAEMVSAGNSLEAVKDSFCSLDLRPLGFRSLFTADWIARAADDSLNQTQDPKCLRLLTEKELRRWELAWGQTPPGCEPIFPAALLANTDIAILALFDGDDIVAGCIANKADGVVGWSNLFGSRPDVCLAATTKAFPGLPVVGYE
ncbi:MAG TPA: hypothetical protein VMV93_07700, partial [Chloroflexota bacterium]|nr:hypothetical protein [Chloroflexota bacterium]